MRRMVAIVNTFVTPDPIVDRVEVWRVHRPEFRSNEVWVSRCRNSIVSCALCAGALSCWKMK